MHVSLPREPPTPTPSHFCRSPQSAGLSFLRFTAASCVSQQLPAGWLFRTRQYMSVLLSQFISASLLPLCPHVHSLRDIKRQPAGYDMLCLFRFTPLTSGTHFSSPEGIQCQRPLQFQYPAQSPACLNDMSLGRSAKLQNKYKLLSPLL